MANIQPGFLGGHLPIHAFYIPPQPANILVATTAAAATVSAASTTKRKAVVATPTATRQFKMIQTAAIIPTHIQHLSSSRSTSVSSSIPSPIIAKQPPFINPPPLPHDNSFDTKSEWTSDNNNNVPWLAPLLGVLGIMGVIIIAIIFFIRRRRYKTSSEISLAHDDPSSAHRNKPITTNKYTSWASLSTINTSAPNMLEEEKKLNHMLHPPPAYSTTTTVRQKRLTADTLVDEPSLAMLKSQYSPQLAFSPSLVAGEFQQQLDHPPLPNANNTTTTTNNHQQISPSNTLIDNAGVLSNEKTENYYSYDSQQRIKIEMYDPQVNLQNADYDDGFETPYSYPNNQEERVNATEGDQHITADTTETPHQVIHMNTK